MPKTKLNPILNVLLTAVFEFENLWTFSLFGFKLISAVPVVCCLSKTDITLI